MGAGGGGGMSGGQGGMFVEMGKSIVGKVAGIASWAAARKAAVAKGKLSKEQLAKAEALRTEAGPRPIMETSQSDQDALSLAKDLASRDKLAGQDLMEGNLRQTSANNVDALMSMGSSSSSIMARSGRVYNEESRGVNKLNIQAAKQKFQAEGELVDQYRTSGKIDDKNWNYNERLPYQEAMAAASALENASILNNQAMIDGKSAATSAYWSSWGSQNTEGYNNQYNQGSNTGIQNPNQNQGGGGQGGGGGQSGVVVNNYSGSNQGYDASQDPMIHGDNQTQYGEII